MPEFLKWTIDFFFPCMAVLTDFTNQIDSIVNDYGIREVLKKYLCISQEMIEGCFLKRPHLCANITISEKKIYV